MNYKPQYKIVRDKFMSENPNCKAKLYGCMAKASEIHHQIGKENIRLIMTQFFLPVCRHCHDWITEHSKEAIEMGLSLNRGHKDVTDAVREFKTNYLTELKPSDLL